MKMKSLLQNCITYEMSHPDHNAHLANKEEFYVYFNEFFKKYKIFKEIRNKC
jgi:hypothetical protein